MNCNLCIHSCCNVSKALLFKFFPTNVYYTQLLSTRFKLLLLLINSAFPGFCLLFVYFTSGIERGNWIGMHGGICLFFDRQTNRNIIEKNHISNITRLFEFSFFVLSCIWFAILFVIIALYNDDIKTPSSLAMSSSM